MFDIRNTKEGEEDPIIHFPVVDQFVGGGYRTIVLDWQDILDFTGSFDCKEPVFGWQEM